MTYGRFAYYVPETICLEEDLEIDLYELTDFYIDICLDEWYRATFLSTEVLILLCDLIFTSFISIDCRLRGFDYTFIRLLSLFKMFYKAEGIRLPPLDGIGGNFLAKFIPNFYNDFEFIQFGNYQTWILIKGVLYFNTLTKY